MSLIWGTPVRLPEMVDGYTYAQALNEGLKNDHLSPRYTQRETRRVQRSYLPRLLSGRRLGGERLCGIIALVRMQTFPFREGVIRYNIMHS